MLIFLDFDGVLHSAHSRPNATLFSQIPIFEQFFNQAEYADCQFVISSTWRINRSLDDLRAYFSPDFRHIVAENFSLVVAVASMCDRISASELIKTCAYIHYPTIVVGSRF